MSTADRLRWILDLVEESLGQPGLTGDDLAARACLSRFHFDRLAAAALGEPPGARRRRPTAAPRRPGRARARPGTT
jgi:transcriptional regulator GlxA family with amidase domain